MMMRDGTQAAKAAAPTSHGLPVSCAYSMTVAMAPGPVMMGMARGMMTGSWVSVSSELFL